MSKVRNSNLLYRPSVSVWTARKLDKFQTEKVNEEAGAVVGAARVNKQLLPECAEIIAVHKFGANFRNWVYARTLPWDDGGARIGQVSRHLDFMQEVGDKMREFDVLVEGFLAKYEEEREQARFKLNNMFNTADYPGVEEVRGKFRIAMDVMPLPDVEDFRIIDGLTPEEAEKLAHDAASAVEERIKLAMDEAYERLFKVVSKLGATLAQYGNKEIKKFNDTLMSNIEDLVGIMPALNITGDPRLSALTSDAKQLLDYDLKDLRKDGAVRAAAVADAEALVAKFNQVMGRASAEVGQMAAVPDVPSASKLAPNAAELFADILSGD